MRNFKKRTIALVLASVVTVAGSFASERFKNSLMGLTFEKSENGSMSMVVQTKSSYSGSLTPIRRDANTYILTLPEMNSSAPTPDLTNNPYIKSVNIRTMPYTNNGNGYTRITIKTDNLQALPVQHRIFLPNSDYGREIQRQKEEQLNKLKKETEQRNYEEKQLELKLAQEQLKREEMEREVEQVLATVRSEKEKQNPVQVQKQFENQNGSVKEPIDISSVNAEPQESNEAFLLIMGLLLIIFSSIYFYIKAKDKMVELSGESLDIDLNDEVEVNKKKPVEKAKTSARKKLNKIKNTIKTLDTKYSGTSNVKKGSEHTPPVKPKEQPKLVEEVNVVDLDKLFQQQVQSQKVEQTEDEVENAALEDFLSGFSFDEEFGIEEPEEEQLYNEELFEEIISGKFKFSQDDIDCINKLVQSEINDETIRNIKDYLVSDPIKQSKEKILEEIMTTYAISQNVYFTKTDVDTLYKLITLEIDSDFVTDLRINPERTKEVEEEIRKSKNKIRKPSEIMTLKVSEALPDLSDALKKQGKRKIQSDYKPNTVYYSEGYDVSTLSISSDLPDLSREINNKNAYAAKPSAEVDLVDNSYNVETLSISSDLPDLSKMIKDPKNFESAKAVTAKVDEKAMLNNIAKVEFKPFDDNSQNFEVLNDFDDFYAVDESDPTDVLTFEEIAAEFEELYSIKITDDNEEVQASNVADDVSQPDNSEQALMQKQIEEELERFFGNEQHVYEEKQENQNIEQNLVSNLNGDMRIEEPLEEKSVTKNLNDEGLKLSQSENLSNVEPKEKFTRSRKRSEVSEEVLNKIKEKRNLKKAVNNVEKNVQKKETPKKHADIKQDKICVIGNDSYNVLSSVAFNDEMGCYLAKNSNGYTVIAYIGEKINVLKTYENLKSEKIQTRVSEKLDNGVVRYIVRIGLNKFIVDVEDNNIKYVMDLC